MRKSNYQQALLSLIAQAPAGTFPVGQVSHVTIGHDSWCKLLRGKGDCNCRPKVRLGNPTDWKQRDGKGAA